MQGGGRGRIQSSIVEFTWTDLMTMAHLPYTAGLIPESLQLKAQKRKRV